MPGRDSVGVFRFRCRCERDGRRYVHEALGLVSKNSRDDEPPWRITFFDQNKDPKAHFAFDDPDGWKREGPEWLLQKLQDYVDRYIEAVEEVTFEPYTGLTQTPSEH